MQESIDRLRLEVEELRASRERLVLAADAERRRIERELHDGPQQQLSALAVNLQHARRLLDVDPAAAAELLDGLKLDVQETLDEVRELAHRIYPPLLDSAGLRAALRSAAAAVGVPTRVEVAAGPAHPPEVAAAVYFCCVEAFECVGDGAALAISVREVDSMVLFEIVEDRPGPATATAALAPMRERVEALGGRLAIASVPGQGIRISGSLPVSR